MIFNLCKLCPLTNKNTLQKNNFATFPPQILYLNVTELNLDKNQIKEIPKEISKMIDLYNLSISENQLTELPKSIKKLVNLRKLNLRGNNFSSKEKKKIKKWLPKCVILF
ncbi:MAG: Leucine-rich repeat (LRR) protein [Flavobacteriales bacterium]|jgi:Leucine-rich repeat (LRR) protein